MRTNELDSTFDRVDKPIGKELTLTERVARLENESVAMRREYLNGMAELKRRVEALEKKL